MKKVLFIAGAVLLIAAACNQQTAETGQESTNNPPPPVSQTPPPQPVSASKVDAAVNVLNASVDSEDAINTTSDNDIVNSDQSLIDSYNGVSNASSF